MNKIKLIGNMRDIKESFEEAVNLVMDELTPSALEEILFLDMHKDLLFYPLFDDAINEASDSDGIENQLHNMSGDIAKEVVWRLDSKYAIFDRQYVKDLEKLVNEK